MTRWLTVFLLLALLAHAAAAQIVVKNHASGATVVSPLVLADVAANDFEDLALDIVNTGSQAVTVNSATATGPYFSLCCQSGFVIPAGGSQTVTLQFAPTQTGYFSGALQIDSLAIFIFGRSDATASLFVQTPAGAVQAHSGTPLIVALTTPANETPQLSCLLENNSGVPVIIKSLTASGGWSLSGTPSLPLVMQPGQQRNVTFLGTVPAAETATVAGVIGVDQWPYAIDAHPPQPNVRLQLPTGPLASGQQVALSIGFDSAPATVLAGSVTLSLETPGPITLSDPGILFPSTGTATAAFSSVAGQLSATFAGQTNVVFQTGTTAGILHVHAAWGYSENDVEIALETGPIVYGTIEAKRETSALDVTVTGYDNTRTAGRMSFSFFDSQGAFIGSPVTADVSEAFYDFFYQTEYNAGGMFKMTAHFPVTGGTGQIQSVQIDLMNKSGDAQSSITRFQ